MLTGRKPASKRICVCAERTSLRDSITWPPPCIISADRLLARTCLRYWSGSLTNRTGLVGAVGLLGIADVRKKLGATFLAIDDGFRGLKMTG